MKLLAGVVVAFLFLKAVVCFGGEREDLRKDLLLLQERGGRLQAEFRLTQIEYQQKLEQLKKLEQETREQQEREEKKK